MIFIGLGANLPSPVFGTPIETLEKCVSTLEERGLTLVAKSSWYKSAPVPMSDQPWYINGVVAIETKLAPRDLLKLLLDVENHFGRVRSEANAPRVLDLDLIAYDTQVIEDEGKIEDKPFCVPHPRMKDRAFVLLPLCEIKSDWSHPISGETIASLIEKLPSDQIIEVAD